MSDLPEPQDDWSASRPDVIPKPTFRPAAMALGITFFFWGFVTSPVVLLVGLGLIVVALAGWIGELRHE